MTIEELKSIQEERGMKDVHLAYLGEGYFTIAHTDEERATIELRSCELHQWLNGLGGPPDVEFVPGIYVATPHQPDKVSEDYGSDPWDFELLSESTEAA